MMVLLYAYVDFNHIIIPDGTDRLFPFLAIGHFSMIAGVGFILGITAAAYSSADSALTALTTSFCIDFLNFKPENFEAKKHIKLRVHLGFSVMLVLVILLFKAINDQSVINSIFSIAGYTYGPLFGLFAFGIFTNYKVKDKYVCIVALCSVILIMLIANIPPENIGGYVVGYELLPINGLLTFLGLILIRRK